MPQRTGWRLLPAWRGGRWPDSYHAPPHHYPYHSNAHYAPAKKTCVFPEKTMNARRVTRYKPCFRQATHPKPPTIFATCLSHSPAQSYPAPVASHPFICGIGWLPASYADRPRTNRAASPPVRRGGGSSQFRVSRITSSWWSWRPSSWWRLLPSAWSLRSASRRDQRESG